MAKGQPSTMHCLLHHPFAKIILLSTVLAATLLYPTRAADSSATSTEDDSDEAEPYDLSEFPQWTKDLRRFEIVSLGSVPFVMFSVATAFSSYLYFSGESQQFINPFARSSYSEKEQMQIFFISIGTGVFIGLTDLTINIIKRRTERKRAMRIKAAEDQIIVVPFKDDWDRPPPDKHPLGEPPRVDEAGEHGELGGFREDAPMPIDTPTVSEEDSSKVSP